MVHDVSFTVFVKTLFSDKSFCIYSKIFSLSSRSGFRIVEPGVAQGLGFGGYRFVLSLKNYGLRVMGSRGSVVDFYCSEIAVTSQGCWAES
jgi:hypothetical protein